MLLRVGELRSLLSPTVHLPALTATATPKLRKKVVSLLGMQDPIFTYISPCRPIIVYSVETFDTIPNTLDLYWRPVTAKMVLAKFGPWTKFCKQILVPVQILQSKFGPPGQFLVLDHFLIAKFGPGPFFDSKIWSRTKICLQNLVLGRKIDSNTTNWTIQKKTLALLRGK